MIDITELSRSLLRLSDLRFQGIGKVSPHLALYCQARTLSPSVEVRVLQLTAELKLGTEALASLAIQRPGTLYTSGESGIEFMGPGAPVPQAGDAPPSCL
jgi:hypothetical protein